MKAMRSKAVSKKPPWPLLYFLFPGSFLEFLSSLLLIMDYEVEVEEGK